MISLRAYADPWLADRKLKPGTRAHYRSLLDRCILPLLGDKPLAGLTITDIRACRPGRQHSDRHIERVRPAASHARQRGR